jgi:hypothetical protein
MHHCNPDIWKVVLVLHLFIGSFIFGKDFTGRRVQVCVGCGCVEIRAHVSAYAMPDVCRHWVCEIVDCDLLLSECAHY